MNLYILDKNKIKICNYQKLCSFTQQMSHIFTVESKGLKFLMYV